MNDNRPRFAKSTFSFFFPENTAPGTPVVALNATDPDEGDYGKVSNNAVSNPIPFRFRFRFFDLLESIFLESIPESKTKRIDFRLTIPHFDE